ncbi:family inorganic anion transporter : Sulphate transporter OS=Blastopirellula marina DSM 3645 GN=DSM3645_29496 PE=4 SV=1: Pro_CA: Sulfate_tra_GLY: Sulfate_transp: STAS_2 [Gemmataceae bacterium]|nr:family inorganic anion transporter : Sulphate transporter OS=Blastopirellula marina DSM 3645 GN=DSM3645_29496 PE=4 SV=1: Pro_CA: Sulfate_tra_GLY: Sulfate_transp: STAS_2 [Gemmataceae bacterium]VTU01441.1 family inorganic anion transporter : Sulphate transporter OS=Blastopirellula marina DSM 3645 GN=DSM3645_29496 PE=4 SV=1: Pro_CA: Sulfate_tra_GLY: Sulfate_transp: STAS_2 [Gemmataceae bacterium]
MEKLIQGLRHFCQNVLWERKELFERSARGQRPLALLITCSDSRVLPDTLMQADPGDLFVSRNAGNIVPPPDTPGGEGATVEYAVTALGVTDIIVCGHYRCGAVKAMLEPAAARDMPKVAAWLAHAGDVRTDVERDHPGAAGDELWDRAVERNVLVQLDSLSKHSVVAAGLAAGTLRLHAWVLRFESSEVLAYDPCSATFSPLLGMPVVHPALPAHGPDHDTEPAVLAAPAVQPPEAARPGWAAVLKHDLPASLVVFLIALPLCLAIAKATGMPPEAGIITGIVGGILVGLIGGSPLQVSGPAAGLVVILLEVVQRHGAERLGAVVLLAGLIQVAAGVLRMGQWFRAVSPAVVLGMLAGIGVVIFAQQFHVLVDDPPANSPLRNLVTIPAAVWHGVADSHVGHPDHQEAAVIGLLTLAVLVLWMPLARGRLRAVPAVLVAVVLATAVTAPLGWPIQRVAFEGLSSAVRQPAGLWELMSDGSVWLTAGVVALVASAETLLCAAAVDQMHRGQRARYDRELTAQGVGNAVCGALGALPMTGVIVRSSANVRAGARTRWSAVFHGVWLLGFVLLAPGALRLIPTAALAAILVLTGVRLVEAHAIRALWRESRVEGAICVVTAATVVGVDLLSGVLLGVGLAVAKLIHTFSRLRIRRRDDPSSGRLTLALEGSATFIRLPKLAAALEKVPPGVTLHVDIMGLSYIDHACLTLLMNWEKQHEATGGKLVLDWETLRARFHTARPRPRTTSQ